MKLAEMTNGRIIAARASGAIRKRPGRKQNEMYVLRKCPRCGNRELKLLDDEQQARVMIICTACGAVGGSFRYGTGIGREYREAVRMAVQAWNTAEVRTHKAAEGSRAGRTMPKRLPAEGVHCQNITKV